MADGAERPDDLDPRVYDPRRDANWQARLEEARAKREIALREKRHQNRPRKRLKPWEEEGAAVLDPEADTDFRPEATGLEFSDRVDAMRAGLRGTSEAASDDVLPEPEPAAQLTRTPADHGGNWRPEAETEAPVSRAAPAPEATEPEAPAANPARPAGSVNDIFADPVFNAPDPEPDPAAEDEPDTIPIALLRVPPPEPPRPRPGWRPDETPEPVGDTREPVVAAAAAATGKTKPARKKKVNGYLSVALVFAAALAIGPIYKMIQPVERGPLVFTLSSFPIEPAFGLTGPMFEQPVPTRSREWMPASLAPSQEPLALQKPNVPERTRAIANFAALPAFGAERSQVVIGLPLLPPPDPGGVPFLPEITEELALGPNGVTDGLGRDLDATLTPPTRPDTGVNG